jgi:ABC-type nitrate/sulfonate/bicarbonate transport system substrate-binding protein
VGIVAVNFAYYSFYAAQELGYMDDENVKLDILATTEEQCMRGLISNSIDACPVGLDSVIKAQSSGAKVIATGVNPTITSIVAKSSIKSWDDLKGKSIGSNFPESGSSIAVRGLLRKNGLDPDKDVKYVVQGSSGDRVSALMAGKVDAAAVGSPGDFVAEAKGFRVLGRTTDAVPYTNLVAAIPGRSEKTDEGLRRMLKAMDKADKWIMDPANKDEAIAMLAKTFAFDPKLAPAIYSLNVEDAGFENDGVNINMAAFNGIAKLIADESSIKVAADPAKAYLDTRYLKDIGLLK